MHLLILSGISALFSVVVLISMIVSTIRNKVAANERQKAIYALCDKILAESEKK